MPTIKGQFFKLQGAALVVTAVFLSANLNSSWANAQGRHGGGGSSSSGSSRSSNSSSSSRSSSGSSSSRSSGSNRSSGSSGSSGSSRRSGGSSRSSNNSSSSGSAATSSPSGSNSSGSGRTWGHRHESKDSSSRGGKRDKGNGDGNAAGGNGSLNSRPNSADRIRTADSTRALTNTTADDRARRDNPEGRRGGHGGRDRDRGKFGPATRYRGGDRSEWHRHECERGRSYYPTTFYYASNYSNYGYGLTAYDHGYEDGLLTGANDAWRGQTYDPERSHFYKHGAGGFLSIFGGPNWYKAAYRDGFLRGYEEGFQNYNSYIVDGKFHR